MHIDKLEVKGFGKLTDRTVYLKKGVNIIYGSNEAGKTTLQWFIRGMLYGLRNTRQSGNRLIPPLKRFEPWEGGQYGGALVYTLDDGSTYRVERNFESGVVQLLDSYFNNITGSFDTGRDKMPMFAERQLGLDEATFERTVLIRQLEVRLDDESTAALAGRLSNVSSTGFEEVSFSRAEKALTEALKTNVGTGRTTTQPLDKLEARLKQLEAVRDRLQRQQEQRLSTQEELQKVQARHSRLESEMQFLEHVGELVEVRKALDVNLKKEAGLKEALKNLREIEGAVPLINEGTDPGGQPTPSKQKWGITPVLCLTATIFFAALLIFTAVVKGILPSWRFMLVYSTGLIISAIAGALMLRRMGPGLKGRTVTNGGNVKVPDMTRAAREAERMALENKIYNGVSILCGRQINGMGAVRETLNETAVKLDKLSAVLEQGIVAIEGRDCNTSGVFNRNDLDTLLYDSDAAGLEKALKDEMDRVKSGLLDAALKEKYYEGLLEDARGDSDELQRMEEETVAVKEKITYLKHKGNALRLAHEVLLEAGLEIKRTFAPGFNSSMSSVITGLTAGRYCDLRGDDKLALKVTVPESGDVKSVLSLSGAATDQMYLALRLAMAGLLTDEKGESLPLILDEIFSQFDDKRTTLALKYIYSAYEKKQVMIFTCKQREVGLAREICGSGLNLVEL